MASDKTSAMTDLEDLNRTLYDIGAQDLLDVWEAMESVSVILKKTFLVSVEETIEYQLIQWFQLIYEKVQPLGAFLLQISAAQSLLLSFWQYLKR